MVKKPSMSSHHLVLSATEEANPRKVEKEAVAKTTAGALKATRLEVVMILKDAL